MEYNNGETDTIVHRYKIRISDIVNIYIYNNIYIYISIGNRWIITYNMWETFQTVYKRKGFAND